MAWYRTGTISVTNGSTTVTGTGTDFVANVGIGHALIGPDGRPYEIAAVVSATQLTLAGGYLGSTASGQSYAIMPTQSFMLDLATDAAELLNSFATVRDGVGAGLHPDGTVSLPAIRFSADQDTGLYRPASNTVAVAIGGTEQLRITSSGIGFGIGATNPSYTVDLVGSAGASRYGDTTSNNTNKTWRFMVRPYANGQVPVLAIGASALETNNLVFIGGGSGSGQAATSIQFYTASAVNTATGTARWSIGSGGTFSPAADNSYDIGSGSFRVKTVYGATGAINTSDAREKTWRGALSDDEYAAGLAVLAELGFYQWNDAIAAKGAENARYHFGVRAQQVWAIFAAHELVDAIEDGEPGATPYSFLCFDSWDEVVGPILDEDGEPTGQTQVVQEAGTRFGIRPDDLNLFLHAVQARRQSDIEARLEALEGGQA